MFYKPSVSVSNKLLKYFFITVKLRAIAVRNVLRQPLILPCSHARQYVTLGISVLAADRLFEFGSSNDHKRCSS